MAKVKSFTTSFGISAEIKGFWQKFNCTVEVEPEEGDNLDEIKNTAWNTVIREVEKQVEEALED